jgi:hypothetical protein
MRNKNIVFLLEVVMVSGILLIVTGIYLHIYEPRIHAMGVVGIVISAGFVAFGMILSLATKMFINFVNEKRS